MPQKKQESQTLSQEEQHRLQQALVHYNEVAQALHNSTQQPEAEATLRSLTSLPENVQIAYLKALSKESTTNAADVVAAFNALAPAKEVRKEAKRSLIRLEGNKTYPQWTPPPAPFVEEEAVSVDTTPPRFWKGLITDTKELGEMQLILCWELGANYKEIRMMGFLLEFWTEGVKDFFTEVSNKRHMEDHIEQMRQQMSGTGVRLTSCSLAEGRRLLQEAQEINAKQQTKPHRAFTRNLPLIRQFVLDAPEAEKEEEVEAAPQAAPTRRNIPGIPMMPQDILDTFFPGMANEEMVGDFIDAWSSADYEMAYDLLASDSPLRDGLGREEWVELRQRWRQEAHPNNINVTFIAEYDEDDEDIEEDLIVEEQPALEAKTDLVEADEDLDEDGEADTVETAWSLEFARTPLITSIKEIPQASAFYAETGRHWFWVRYSLIEEDGNLRIHDMIDETALAVQLPPAEIQQRMEKIALLAGKRLDDLERKLQDEDDDKDQDDDYNKDEDDFDVDEEDLDEDEEDEEDEEEEDMLDTFNRMEEALQIATRYMHYTDALITQAPTSNAAMYRQAYDFARVAQDFERAAVYLQQLAEHFPNQRAKTLQDLTLVQLNIAYNYSQEEEEEREQQFLKIAEETIRDSITLANTPESLTTLAQILVGQNKQLDEAEDLLEQARNHTSEAHNLALIESNLAKIAELRENTEQALKHYRHAAEIDPTFPKIWINLGFLQYDLEQYDSAIESLKRSVELNPDDIEGYIGLSEVYRSGLQDYKSAEEILLKGMEVNEESADILGSLAMVYIDQSDLRKAEKYLEMAEEASPESSFLEEVREAFELAQAEQRRNKRTSGTQQHKKHKPKSKKR
jgi:tetratricopeptide (TPR) repeat protein